MTTICLTACGADTSVTPNLEDDSTASAEALEAADEGIQPVLGCDGASLLEALPGSNLRGPWPVGERTLSIGRLNTVEVLYPAKPGSEVEQPVISYDLRTFLPQSEQSKVPDAEATVVSADTYRDLPLDDAHGPYPAVIFVHGTGAYRVGSLSTLAQWASRGFVVIAADHPGVYLADVLATNGCGQLAPYADVNGDVDAELTALTEASGPLSFLAGRVDLQRIALSGHSSGAYEVANFSTKPGVQTIVSLAGTRAVAPSNSLRSVLFIGGIADSVMPYRTGTVGYGSVLYPGSTEGAYAGSPGPGNVAKRLVGLGDAGHLNLTDMCQTNTQGVAPLEAARVHGVCGVDSVIPLANCGAIDRARATEVVNEASVNALQETLQCRDRSAVFAALQPSYPEIAELRQGE